MLPALKIVTQLYRKEPIDGDIVTIIRIDLDGTKRIVSQVKSINELGYTPILSSVTGFFRTLVNLVDVASTVFSAASCQLSLKEAGARVARDTALALRGVVEMVPLLGNITMYAIDQLRIKAIESAIVKETKDKTNFLAFYLNGRGVATSNSDSLEFCASFIRMFEACFALPK